MIVSQNGIVTVGSRSIEQDWSGPNSLLGGGFFHTGSAAIAVGYRDAEAKVFFGAYGEDAGKLKMITGCITNVSESEINGIEPQRAVFAQRLNDVRALGRSTLVLVRATADVPPTELTEDNPDDFTRALEMVERTTNGSSIVTVTLQPGERIDGIIFKKTQPEGSFATVYGDIQCGARS